MSYFPSMSQIKAVDSSLKTQEHIPSLLRQNKQKPQARMKKYAYIRRKEQSFVVGEWVYVRLQLDWQQTLTQRKNMKLSPRFYMPFLILERIGTMAYRLDLPESAQIHLVFHVSLLKKKLGWSTQQLSHLPPVDSMGLLKLEPEDILDRRVRKKGVLPLTKVLVRWQGQEDKDASWENLNKMWNTYLHLVGNVFWIGRVCNEEAKGGSEVCVDG